jgi:hypothetical protein
MRRGIVLAGVLALAMLVMGPAWAKGPTGATITGPGIDEPIELEGDGELQAGSEFSRFVETAGFWQLVYDVEPPVLAGGQVLSDPPADLGARYTITWHLGGDSVATDLYPEAAGGPVLHLAAQRLEFMDHDAREQWFAAAPALLTMLDDYGVPFRPTPATPEPAPADTPVARSATPAAEPEPLATDGETAAAGWMGWLAAAAALGAAVLVVGRRRAGAA